MTGNPIDLRQQMYSDLKAELFKRQLSNSENFDKAIMAYSSVGLGASLGFLKDFIALSKAGNSWLLYLSWAAFVVAIVATIISFISSQLGITKQLKLAERYYLKSEDTALSIPNYFARATDWLSYLSGSAFVVAVISTTLFVSTNLERAAIMAEEKKVQVERGATVPSIQPVAPSNGKFGAPVPEIQKVPQQQQPVPSTTTTSGTGGSGKPGS